MPVLGETESITDAVLPAELIHTLGMRRTESRRRNEVKEKRQTRRVGEGAAMLPPAHLAPEEGRPRDATDGAPCPYLKEGSACVAER